MVQLITVAACAVSALIQVAIHVYAWNKAWTRVRRYAIGSAIANAAVTAALWLALDAEAALIATGVLWCVYVANGLVVWYCYEERKRRATSDDPTPEASRLLAQLNQELTDGDLPDAP